MRKMLSVFMLFFLYVFLLLPTNLYAQRRSASQLIGTVDFRVLILLHPAMAKYEPNKKAFKIDSSKVAASQVEKRQKENQQRIRDLTTQTRRFQALMTEQHRNYEREMTRLSNNYLEKMKGNPATATAALESQTYNINRKLSETNHRAKLRMLGDQLAAATDHLTQLQRTAHHVGFSTPEETKQQFAAILAEVRQFVQQTAAQKGIEIVLNSGFRRSFSMSDQSQGRTVPPGHSYETILSSPYQTPQGETQHFVNEYIVGYYANIADQTKDWLRYESSILAPFAGDFVDTDIIMGGTDITAEVLTALFRRYQINENIGNAIIRAAVTR